MKQLVFHFYPLHEGTSYIQEVIVTSIIFVIYEQHPYQKLNVMTAIQNP
jgi:hypothetical protein